MLISADVGVARKKSKAAATAVVVLSRICSPVMWRWLRVVCEGIACVQTKVARRCRILEINITQLS
jgi:hypothetical protein